MEGDLPFLLCFTLYLRVIFEYKPSGGLIFGGPIKRRVFCVTSFFFFLGGGGYIWRAGLYMEGLIFGSLR